MLKLSQKCYFFWKSKLIYGAIAMRNIQPSVYKINSSTVLKQSQQIIVCEPENLTKFQEIVKNLDFHNKN